MVSADCRLPAPPPPLTWPIRGEGEPGSDDSRALMAADSILLCRVGCGALRALKLHQRGGARATSAAAHASPRTWIAGHRPQLASNS